MHGLSYDVHNLDECDVFMARLLEDASGSIILCFAAISYAKMNQGYFWRTGLSDIPLWHQECDTRTRNATHCNPMG